MAPRDVHAHAARQLSIKHQKKMNQNLKYKYILMIKYEVAYISE